MSQVPADISALREKRVLAVRWEDRQDEIAFFALRTLCQCAHCVNEWTGERILDPANVPSDIVIEKMEPVGGYAIRVHWSDGHNSGLYTWVRLREIGDRLSQSGD